MVQCLIKGLVITIDIAFTVCCRQLHGDDFLSPSLGRHPHQF